MTEVMNLGAEEQGTGWNFFSEVGGFLDNISKLIEQLKKAGIITGPPAPEPLPVPLPVEEPKFWEQSYFPWLIGGGIAAGGVGTILYAMKKKRR